MKNPHTLNKNFHTGQMTHAKQTFTGHIIHTHATNTFSGQFIHTKHTRGTLVQGSTYIQLKIERSVVQILQWPKLNDSGQKK